MRCAPMRASDGERGNRSARFWSRSARRRSTLARINSRRLPIRPFLFQNASNSVRSSGRAAISQASARAIASMKGRVSAIPMACANISTCGGLRSSKDTIRNAVPDSADWVYLRWRSQSERSVSGRQAAPRLVITICVRASAVDSRLPIMRMARSKSAGHLSLDSSTESKNSHACSFEASHRSNSVRFPTSKAPSSPLSTYSRRKKNADFPNARSFWAACRVSAVLPVPASDRRMVR